jgi:lysophospholipid acyltransferase (LPLAT)-like uncharacterized protein
MSIRMATRTALRVADERRSGRREALIAGIGVWIVRLLGMTWRMRVTHDEPLRAARAAGKPVIFALWHGQLLPLLYHHRNQNIAILISEHADGEIIARIAHSLGCRTVRGSTSRGAARALLGLVRVIGEGNDLAITPDGPRGPARTVAPGVLVVAQRSGAAIVPIAAVASSGWRLRSWDSFLIPRPFARVHVSYGELEYVNAEQMRDALTEADRVRDALTLAEQRARA